MNESYCGIIPPLVTPLSGPDELDAPGLERLIDHMLAGGVHGLFVLGTTGEFASLSYRLRREVVDRACGHVAGRAPVLVGIADTSAAESVGMARYAASCGASALVLAPPYYYPASQEELAGYVERLVRQLPLPLFLYNMPAMTKLVFEPGTVRRLLDCPAIIGLKDSSGDLEYFKQAIAVARQRPGWRVLVGPEHLLADTMALGGDGGVCGGANLFPRLFVDVYEATRRGDRLRLATLQQCVLRLGKIYQVGSDASGVIGGLKCALALSGLCNDIMAEPFQAMAGAQRDTVGRLLGEVRAVLQ